jgi:hypothetical protein
MGEGIIGFEFVRELILAGLEGSLRELKGPNGWGEWPLAWLINEVNAAKYYKSMRNTFEININFDEFAQN